MPPLGDSRAGIQAADVRGTAGFFRAARDTAGRWWFVAPDGKPFFARAVHGVTASVSREDQPCPRDPAARLRAWGFNGVGIGGDATGRLDGFPFLAAVEFSGAAAMISAPGVRLPDVFEPEWPRLAAARAAGACAELRESAALLGWVSDSSLRWGPLSGAQQPGLLQTCLSLEPRFPAYHAAWEFVLAPRGGNLDALAHAWHTPLANKEVVREMTRAEAGLTSRGYWRDDALWTREFARRYFTVTGQAIRAADPNHLVFGCRFSGAGGPSTGGAGPHVLAECVYPVVDVAMPGWHELPENDAMPLLPEVSWSDESFRTEASARDRGLTGVERMLRRARAGLARMAQHRAVTGFIWAEWQDAPADRPPFGRGLVHADGSEAREHTELLAAFNARAETLRGKPKRIRL